MTSSISLDRKLLRCANWNAGGELGTFSQSFIADFNRASVTAHDFLKNF